MHHIIMFSLKNALSFGVWGQTSSPQYKDDERRGKTIGLGVQAHIGRQTNGAVIWVRRFVYFIINT